MHLTVFPATTMCSTTNISLLHGACWASAEVPSAYPLLLPLSCIMLWAWFSLAVSLLVWCEVEQVTSGTGQRCYSRVLRLSPSCPASAPFPCRPEAIAQDQLLPAVQLLFGMGFVHRKWSMQQTYTPVSLWRALASAELLISLSLLCLSTSHLGGDAVGS